jgi:hypothetical protein
LNTAPCQDKERFALHGDPLQYRSIRRIIGPVRARRPVRAADRDKR